MKAREYTRATTYMGRDEIRMSIIAYSQRWLAFFCFPFTALMGVSQGDVTRTITCTNPKLKATGIIGALLSPLCSIRED
jgi:hypothetical protein